MRGLFRPGNVTREATYVAAFNRPGPTRPWRYPMLQWAGIFFVIAIIAAIFGFGGVAGSAAGVAQVLFFLFLVFFVITVIGGWMGRGRSSPW